MLRILAFILTISTSGLLYGQQKAVTEMGEEVILYADGTWKYQDGESQYETEITTNPDVFEKDADYSFLLKSKVFNVDFYLNPKKWSFKKATENEDAEYEFSLIGEDLYGVAITEKTEIPLPAMQQIALENARSVAPDAYIVTSEYRMVNGEEILFMEIRGTMQGIKLSYLGYYFSNENGTVQLITFASQRMMEEYRTKSMELLNGLVVLNN